MLRIIPDKNLTMAFVMLIPFPAMAANIAPPGFEDLPQVYSTGFP